MPEFHGAPCAGIADPALRHRSAGFGADVFPEAERTPEANARLQAEIAAIRDTMRTRNIRPGR